MFKMGEAEAHSALDKLENPIKMTEQGIRDLKKDLAESLQNLASAKAILIKMRKDAESKKRVAASYEKKAILLLKKAEAGDLDPSEADRLASEALVKKEQAMTQAATFSKDLEAQNQQTAKLESVVGELKASIGKWENELTTLKARAKVASASKKLNKQLAAVDSSSTIAMLDKMKQKVEEDEALAASYGDVAALETGIDSEIDKALGGSVNPEGQDSLAALKAKLKGGS